MRTSQAQGMSVQLIPQGHAFEPSDATSSITSPRLCPNGKTQDRAGVYKRVLAIGWNPLVLSTWDSRQTSRSPCSAVRPRRGTRRFHGSRPGPLPSQPLLVLEPPRLWQLPLLWISGHTDFSDLEWIQFEWEAHEDDLGYKAHTFASVTPTHSRLSMHATRARPRAQVYAVQV
jgi:hypothetical protein